MWLSPDDHALISTAKDIGVLCGLGALVWKLIAFLQSASQVAKQIPAFMVTTTEQLGEIHKYSKSAVENHLTHMQASMEKLSTIHEQHLEDTRNLNNIVAEHIVDDAKVQTLILEKLREIKDEV